MVHMPSQPHRLHRDWVVRHSMGVVRALQGPFGNSQHLVVWCLFGPAEASDALQNAGQHAPDALEPEGEVAGRLGRHLHNAEQSLVPCASALYVACSKLHGVVGRLMLDIRATGHGVCWARRYGVGVVGVGIVMLCRSCLYRISA